MSPVRRWSRMGIRRTLANLLSVGFIVILPIVAAASPSNIVSCKGVAPRDAHCRRDVTAFERVDSYAYYNDMLAGFIMFRLENRTSGESGWGECGRALASECIIRNLPEIEQGDIITLEVYAVGAGSWEVSLGALR